MKRIATFVSGFVVTLLSACTAGPDFKTPAPPETKNYTAMDEVLTTAQHIELGKQLETEWWKLFASPSLDDVIQQAMANNDNIAAAQQIVAQAQEAVMAENGSRLPQLSLDANAGRQKYGAAMFGPSDFSIPPFSYYEAGPSLSWMPDFSGGKRRRIERQQALAEYQMHQLDAAYIALTANVVTQALDYATAKSEIAATEQIINEDRDTLASVNAAYQAGAATQVDVLSARSQFENDQATLPPLQQQISVSRHALAMLVGQAPGDWTPPDFTMDNFTLPNQLPLDLPSELVRKRPDILAAEANLHAASAAIGITTANLYPQITLTANTMQEALTPSGLLQRANNAWGLAAGLTAPLFNGGTLSAEKREAEHAYQAALAQYKQTVLHAFGQVADALTALAHDGEAVNAQQQALHTTDVSLQLVHKRYEAGSVGLLEVQDAERQHARAQLGLIHAQRQQLLDTTQLFVALGNSPVRSRINPSSP